MLGGCSAEEIYPDGSLGCAVIGVVLPHYGVFSRSDGTFDRKDD
jgi:hypothetical protein